MSYQERIYRYKTVSNLKAYEVRVMETDLYILALEPLKKKAEDSVKKYRQQIEDYIKFDRNFLTSLKPVRINKDALPIIKEMGTAGEKVNVGPFASVAGAIAEYVGKDLSRDSEEVIVENGGDIFIKTKEKRNIGIFTGDEQIDKKLVISIKPEQTPLGICTSSGSIGHSLSFGRADAVTVLSKSTALADAAATCLGNIVKSADDINKAIEYSKKIEGISGVIIVIDRKIGICGNITIEK